jgi:hypothetical protein
VQFRQAQNFSPPLHGRASLSGDRFRTATAKERREIAHEMTENTFTIPTPERLIRLARRRRRFIPVCAPAGELAEGTPRTPVVGLLELGISANELRARETFPATVMVG